MIIFYENEAGEQYRLEVFDDSEETVNKILDELNKSYTKYIEEKDFKLIKPYVISLFDEETQSVMGTLTCEDLGYED